MNGVRVYVGSDVTNSDIILNGEAIDLYKDESIEITLKQTDVSDISSNFSDYTQSFTVPASPKNNRIFKYWFDTLNDDQFSSVANIPARIDIDGIFFKKGTIKITRAQSDANGIIKNYTINFTANLKSLKDKFGEIKISELDYTEVLYANEFPISDTLVKGYIESATNSYGIHYPLVSTKRLVDDFDDFKYINSSTANGYKFEELRPAITTRKIFEAIEKHFNIAFIGGFYEPNSVIDQIYIWLNKNKEPFVNESKIITISGTSISILDTVGYSTAPSSYCMSINDTHNYFTLINWYSLFGVTRINSLTAKVTLQASNLTPYRIFIQKLVLNTDGSINETATSNQVNNGYVASSPNFVTGTKSLSVTLNTFGYPSKAKFASYRIVVETIGATTFNSTSIFTTVSYVRSGSFDNLKTGYSYVSTEDNVLVSSFSIPKNVPDMTVYDYLNSFIKMFNLVNIPNYDVLTHSLYGTSDVFQLEYFTEYYGKLNQIDITKYTKRNFNINKIKTYKNFELKHADSSYGMNNLFKKAQSPEREFGAVKIEFLNGDESDFNIESKFNLMMWREIPNFGVTSSYTLNDTWIIGDCLDEDFSEAVFNKPTIFYYNGKSTVPSGKKLAYTLSNNTSLALGTYSIFSNVDDLDIFAYTNTLTYSSESQFDSVLDKNLYSNFYEGLITGVFSKYSREYEYEAILPKSIYTTLSLGNQIIIGNNRYAITDLTINLINGNTKLKLNNVIEESPIIETNVPIGTEFAVEEISRTFYSDSLGGFTLSDINIYYPNTTDSLKWRADYTLATQSYTDARVSFVSTAGNGFVGLLWYDFYEPSGQSVGNHVTSVNNFIPVGTYPYDSAGSYSTPINCQLKARTGNTITLDIWAYDASNTLIDSSSITI